MQFKRVKTQNDNFLVYQVNPTNGHLVPGPCFYITPEGMLMNRVEDAGHEYGWAKKFWKNFQPEDLPQELQATVEELFKQAPPPKKAAQKDESPSGRYATHRPFEKLNRLVEPAAE